MEGLKPGDSIKFEISEGFCEYNVNGKPKILISTGTGIAPHMSLIEEMNELGHTKADNLMVVFGCRSSTADFICKKELDHLQSEYKTAIFKAFSRENNEKVYVQHIIETTQRELISGFIEKNFKDIEIYVCGNSKFLPKSIDRLNNKGS